MTAQLMLISALCTESLPSCNCVVAGVSRSQWPRGLRRRSTAARLLRLWVLIPPVAWMFVCFVCCLLSGRGLCDGLFTRPEESYRLWCVAVCDLTSVRDPSSALLPWFIRLWLFSVLQTEVTIERAPVWRCSRHPSSCDIETSGHTTRRPTEVLPFFARSCHLLYWCRTGVLWIKYR